MCPNCGYCPACGRGRWHRPWTPCVPIAPAPCMPYVVERTKYVLHQPTLGEFVNALS